MKIEEFEQLPLPDKITQITKDARFCGFCEGMAAGFAVIGTIGLFVWVLL